MADNSSSSPLIYCLQSRPGLLIFTAFFIANIFLIPLFFLILYMGYQRYRNQRSVSTTASHSDIFTYNVVVLELLSLVGCCLYCCGGLRNIPQMMRAGLDVFSFTSPGQSLFHVLTCVERYLAVVQPITYLGLRRGRGVRMRNVAIGGVWLLCLALLGCAKLFSQVTFIFTICCFMVVLIIIVTFCSFSVLWILIRPGPGKGGADRDGVDQSKRKAFNTVSVIMGVLWMRFVGVLVSGLMSRVRLTDVSCAVSSSVAFFTVPGSLVLPLLFLLRAGKLPGFKQGS